MREGRTYPPGVEWCVASLMSVPFIREGTAIKRGPSFCFCQTHLENVRGLQFHFHSQELLVLTDLRRNVVLHQKQMLNIIVRERRRELVYLDGVPKPHLQWAKDALSNGGLPLACHHIPQDCVDVSTPVSGKRGLHRHVVAHGVSAKQIE